MAELHSVRYELITTELDISLVQGLTAAGQFGEATTLLEGTMRHVITNGDTCYMPELLRVKAALLRSTPTLPADEAETCLRKSLELSRNQGARSWELRTAIDLATLLAEKGYRQRGTETLQQTFEQFTEGFDTVDLKAAKRQLESRS